jgi:LysM domain
MPRHTVKQGECLSSIALRYGFNDWKIVYDDPNNEELRQKRPNPNVIFPGDKVFIPEKKVRYEALGTGQTHQFQVKLPRKELRIVLKDHKDEPIADEPFQLEIDGVLVEGSTDGSGLLKQRLRTPQGPATLTIRGRKLSLQLGALNPMRDTVDEGVSGVVGRLRNMGYAASAAGKGDLGPGGRVALAIFKADAGSPIDGKIDDATLQALEDEHGC